MFCLLAYFNAVKLLNQQVMIICKRGGKAYLIKSENFSLNE